MSSPNSSPKPSHRQSQVLRSKSISSPGRGEKGEGNNNNSNSNKKEATDPKSPSSPESAVGGSEMILSGPPMDDGEESKEPGDGKSPIEGHNALSKFAFDEPEEESRKCCAKRDHILGIKVLLSF